MLEGWKVRGLEGWKVGRLRWNGAAARGIREAEHPWCGVVRGQRDNGLLSV